MYGDTPVLASKSGSRHTKRSLLNALTLRHAAILHNKREGMQLARSGEQGWKREVVIITTCYRGAKGGVRGAKTQKPSV